MKQVNEHKTLASGSFESPLKRARELDGFARSRFESPAVRVCTDLDDRLPYPHYTDDVWREGRLIFGKQQKTKMDAYDDRLAQWDWQAAERAHQSIRGRVERQTARWHQEWLSAYHNKPVTLHYIMAGVNLSSGYPYYYYGYDFADSAAP